jgi:hypothetical protein
MKVTNIFFMLLVLSSFSTSYAMVEKAPIKAYSYASRLRFTQAADHLHLCRHELDLLAPNSKITNISNKLVEHRQELLRMAGLPPQSDQLVYFSIPIRTAGEYFQQAILDLDWAINFIARESSSTNSQVSDIETHLKNYKDQLLAMQNEKQLMTQ